MKRRLLIVIVFGVIGAVLNILVAWGCVLTWMPVNNPSRGGRINESATEHYYWGLSQAIGQELRWKSTTCRTDGTATTDVYRELRAGWPTHSLKWYAFDPVQVTNEVGVFWHEPTDAGMPRRTPPVWIIETFRHSSGFETLPTKPIWLGFVYNSSLFGLIAFLLALGVRTRRRIIWRKTNQCDRCGYPRGAADVCTECGTAFTG